MRAVIKLLRLQYLIIGHTLPAAPAAARHLPSRAPAGQCAHAFLHWNIRLGMTIAVPRPGRAEASACRGPATTGRGGTSAMDAAGGGAGVSQRDRTGEDGRNPSTWGAGSGAIGGGVAIFMALSASAPATKAGPAASAFQPLRPQSRRRLRG